MTNSKTAEQVPTPLEMAQWYKEAWADCGYPLTQPEIEKVSKAFNALESLLNDGSITLYAEQYLIDARDFLAALIEEPDRT